MRRRVLPLLVAGVLFCTVARAEFDYSRLSMAEADRMDAAIKDVLKRRHDGRPLPPSVAFTESELNSYLNYRAGTQLPPNLKNIDINLEPDWVVADADVDLKEVKSGTKTKLPAALQRSFTVHISGKLYTHKGSGYFQADSIRIGFLPIPVSWLDAIVQYLTEQQSGKPHSLKDWFQLPYGVQEVKIQQDKIELTP